MNIEISWFTFGIRPLFTSLLIASLSVSCNQGSKPEANKTNSSSLDIRISDPRFPVLAIRDIHPSYEASFLLSMNLLHQRNVIRNEHVIYLLKLSYQRMCEHLRHTTYKPKDVQIDPSGGYAEYSAISRLQEISFKFYSKSLTAPTLAKLQSALASDIRLFELEDSNTKSSSNESFDTGIYASYSKGELPSTLDNQEAASWLLAWAVGIEQAPIKLGNN